MYKKGGKPSKKKESFMEESKEIHFGSPMKKYLKGGSEGDPKKDNMPVPSKSALAEVSPKKNPIMQSYTISGTIPETPDERSRKMEALKKK